MQKKDAEAQLPPRWMSKEKVNAAENRREAGQKKDQERKRIGGREGRGEEEKAAAVRSLILSAECGHVD